MNIAVIQARMTSTRFPGKVMKMVLGKPLLEHLIERLGYSRKINKIIVATTKDKSDNQIEDLARKLSVGIYRGEVNDVLDRYYSAVYKYNPKNVLRITADCPLVDPRHCDLIIETLGNENSDYVCLGQSFAEGSDAAVFTFKALYESYKYSSNPLEREHITLYIHNNPRKYKRIILENKRDDSRFRFTVDEKNDFKVVKEIVSYFHKNNNRSFSYEDIISFLKNNPKITGINSTIIRNEGYIKTLSQNSVKEVKDILFRVDGSKMIGWGHVMRCIGLAEEFKKRGYRPIFIIRDGDDQIINKIRSYGFTIELLPENNSIQKQSTFTASVIKKYKALSLIVDLSNASTFKELNSFKQYINTLKKSVNKIILIDGYGSESISAKVNLNVDIVIIPYINAKINSRFKSKEAICLLGSDYSVIRQEFLKERKKRKTIKEKAKNILVLPGGSLNTLFLTKVLRSFNLINSKNLSVKIITKNTEAFRVMQHIQPKKIQFEIIQDFLNVANLYKWADIAISASGLTMYELAFMGLPAIVISHDSAHEKITNNFMKAGTIKHIGSKKRISENILSKSIDALIIDKNTRKLMSLKGKALIDGNGVKRIVSRIIMKELL